MKVTSTWQHLGKPRAAVVVAHGPDAKTPAELTVESATASDVESFGAQAQVDYVKIDDGKRKKKKGRTHGN
jgi:hypothetical protein